ncbi:MAG: methylenetetrahydrofolate reductase C-terminal domain-containing protein [Candidatus Hydrogenedentota bacterium]|nr:MAG: methylenetetrahydrofolate reductase C-terminal domain-containing protein [Candidatus Hydrogenedentota bacterium]
MIISTQKPLEEIKASVAPYHKLAIIGCGGCAAVCQAGGTKQVEELARALGDKEIVFTIQIDEPCDQRILARELRRVSDRLEKVDAVLMLACGTGVQVLASAVDRPCLTGLDTVFPGTVIHSNNYVEVCSACGECILNLTAAICPRTLCPKSIINGPCSEKLNDKCSVDSESDCVWITITDRVESLGVSGTGPEFSPMDWAKRTAPRTIPDRKSSIRKAEGER